MSSALALVVAASRRGWLGLRAGGQGRFASLRDGLRPPLTAIPETTGVLVVGRPRGSVGGFGVSGGPARLAASYWVLHLILSRTEARMACFHRRMSTSLKLTGRHS